MSLQMQSSTISENKNTINFLQTDNQQNVCELNEKCNKSKKKKKKQSEKPQNNDESQTKKTDSYQKNAFSQFENNWKVCDSQMYEDVWRKLECQGRQIYQDELFPCTIESLACKHWKEELIKLIEYENIIWKRPQELMKEFSLFGEKGIQVKNIIQGTLKNCYLLSTLASLAQNPQQLFSIERIQKLFKTRHVNTFGCYCVYICFEGEWREVIIDDFIPVQKLTNKTYFAGLDGNQIWVSLLEKAWAKINGGFLNLEMGAMRETLHSFTGAPCDNYFLEDEDKEEIWVLINRSFQQGFCLTCGSKPKEMLNETTEKQLKNNAVIVGHAYTLLNAHIGEKTRIIKLRNPWGKDRLNETQIGLGHRKVWDKLSQRDKNLLEYYETLGDQGISYMTYNEFYSCFFDLQICKVHDTFKYSSLRGNILNKSFSFYEIKVPSSGEYAIAVTQTAQTQEQLNINKNLRKYDQVTMLLGKLEESTQQFKYIAGNQDNNGQLYVQDCHTPTLEGGVYIMAVKLECINQSHSQDFVVSCYGCQNVEISSINRIDRFLHSVFLHHAQHLSQNKRQIKSSSLFVCIEQMKEGYIYVAAWNQSTIRQCKDSVDQHEQNELIYTCQFTIKDMTGLKLKKPFKGNSIQFSLLPGQSDIALIRCKDLSLIKSFDIEQKFIY